MTSLASPTIHVARGALPVLLSVPHAGRDYPASLIELSAAGKSSLTMLEDPYVDRLVWRALQRGCGAVIARAPRAAIDCNRSEDEVDPSVVEGLRRGRISARARGGLGIVPARTQQDGYLWRRAITAKELDDRLSQAHRPFHDAVEAQLELLLDRFGCALLLDCHSMPPPADGVAPIVFGDGRGRTADGWVSAEAIAIVRRSGLEAGLNDPFAGGHIIERHARPQKRIHALQVEIDRRCYLDDKLQQPGSGFARIAALLESVAVELGEALIAHRYATAAE